MKEINLLVTQKKAVSIHCASSQYGPPLHPQEDTKNVVRKGSYVSHSQLAKNGCPFIGPSLFFRVCKRDSKDKKLLTCLAVSGEDEEREKMEASCP